MALRILVNGTGEWDLPQELLRDAVRETLRAEGVREAEISLTLLDDQEIRRMNQEYLDRPRPTDVLAFALHEENEAVLGDVYLGFEQARRQARELALPLEEELLRLAIHGTLHVLGYDHPQGEDRQDSPMYRRQEELLSRIRSTSRPPEDPS